MARTIHYDGVTRAKQPHEMTLIPARIGAQPQKRWVTVIINGQMMEKAEAPLVTAPVRWQIYDWRRKNGEVIELQPGR